MIIMRLMDILQRVPVPEPWAEGEKIPWDEPAFSERMLREHLSQAHDAASRRAVMIDAQVNWIHAAALGGQPGRVLDLGCGPGLYTSRLARRGHTCAGIDFSPASIAYARQQAEAENLTCTYTQADIRQADYGSGYDLIMLIYGELNVFRPDDARQILRRAHTALRPGGALLLEVQPFDAVRQQGQQPPSWYTATGGLFSPDPHLVLQENFWDAAQQVATERYYLIDAASGAVSRIADSIQAYTQDAYRALLADCGFAAVRFLPALTGGAEVQPGMMAIQARRPQA
jgi:SAM-dependent methyltransferase